MSIDNFRLSPASQKIFETLKPFFPIGPFNQPRWLEEGKVYSNGWFDLKKSGDRRRLEAQVKNFIGYLVQLEAIGHRKEHGSMKGFGDRTYTRQIHEQAEMLLLLDDLDFQIETRDIVDGYDDTSKGHVARIVDQIKLDKEASTSPQPLLRENQGMILPLSPCCNAPIRHTTGVIMEICSVCDKECGPERIG